MARRSGELLKRIQIEIRPNLGFQLQEMYLIITPSGVSIYLKFTLVSDHVSPAPASFDGTVRVDQE